MKRTTNPMLEWRENNLPISTRFDDPYFSKEDGRAECDHVFINGNDLPARWPHMEQCTIAELGFGTGLNFLETVAQWQAINLEKVKLHFISFEQYPMSQDDMAKALSNWPQLYDLAQQLTTLWDTSTGLLDVQFTHNIRLSVHMGDANEILPTLSFVADAWYLDGFSPAKNPELWNDKLMREVTQHTKLDGTFATYTAAGFVKRALMASGFDVKKTKGFARKRDMLVGKKSSDIDVADKA